MSKLDLGCAQHRAMARWNRRAALKIGAVGGLGISLADALRSEALAATAAKAKSVIFLWLQGGVSHHETFDMKPQAPADIRGEMVPIGTKLPGVYVGECLPEIAKIMDRLAVVRSVTHSESAHQRGSIYMVEGRRPPRATGVEASGSPHLGSIVAHELGMRGGVPPYVSIPGNDFTSRFTGHGFLPPSSEAFKGHNARTLAATEQITSRRFSDRAALLDAVRNAGGSPAPAFSDTWDQFSDQAIDIISSGKAAAAFNLDEESDETKQAYGVLDADGKNGRGQMGELCLTARRLVEAGVRFVTVGRNSWDHHSNMFPQLRSRLPRVDKALSGLILDLEQRGLLDDTLVVYSTEFGRTPKINSQAGRDHWARVFSVAFAGAGISAGQVLGESDKIGGDVADYPVSPEELAATILHLVGINPQQSFIDRDARPRFYVDEARPVARLLS